MKIEEKILSLLSAKFLKTVLTFKKKTELIIDLDTLYDSGNFNIEDKEGNWMELYFFNNAENLEYNCSVYEIGDFWKCKTPNWLSILKLLIQNLTQKNAIIFTDTLNNNVVYDLIGTLPKKYWIESDHKSSISNKVRICTLPKGFKFFKDVE